MCVCEGGGRKVLYVHVLFVPVCVCVCVCACACACACACVCVCVCACVLQCFQNVLISVALGSMVWGFHFQ